MAIRLKLVDRETDLEIDNSRLWTLLYRYLSKDIYEQEINKFVDLEVFKIISEEFNGNAEDFYNQHKKELDKDTGKLSIFKRRFNITNINKFKRELKEEYPDSFYDPEFRKKILEEQNFRCALCEASLYETKAHLHHIDYNKQNCNKENLIFLCPRCHGKTNSNRKFWKGLLMEYKENNGTLASNS